MNDETLNLTPKELMEVVKAILKNPDQYVSDPYGFMVDVEIAAREYFEVNELSFRKVDGEYVPVVTNRLHSTICTEGTKPNDDTTR